ncbi:hypothetical protein [Actinomadura litoris]|uniref:hypothetical protein n=1 Tax=Actinomadura litoris TaxID=2678616 RepID=UPI001564BBC1|nr:hypothetical protein [Actinomadura litoris]
MDALTAPFTITPGAEDRYAANVQQRQITFLNGNGDITPDPTEFACAAFGAATGTGMPPPHYVPFVSPIAWARLHRRRSDGRAGGPVRAYVRIMTRPIEPLMDLDGWSGWEYRQDIGLCEPSDDQIEQTPAMCTSTLLLFCLPTDRLWVPVDAPERLTAADATAAVRRVVELLNERVQPVVERLEGDR